MIKNGSKVKFHYTLEVDGRLVESSEGADPLTYIHGSGQIVQGLEEELEGMSAGDATDVVVPPEKGFGLPDPAAVQKVPRSAFNEPDDLNVGDKVTGKAGEQPFRARVTDVDPDGITLDLNHPLAGKTLHFSVDILDVD